jgi:hypothetical protein
MSIEKYLLRLYPRIWRARYEEELLAVLESRPLSFPDTIDMLLGAIDAHLHPYLGAKGMPLQERIIHMLRALRRSLITLFCAYIGFVLAGMAFQKLTEYEDFVAAAQAHSLVGTSFTLVVIGSVLALLAILAGGLPIAFAVVKDALATKRIGRLLLLAVPLLAFAALLGTIQLLGHTFASQLPKAVGATIFFGTLLAAAVVSTASVSIAVTRSKISDKLFRFAILPSVIATSSMVCMLLATIFWGLSLQSAVPQLFAGNDGIMGSSTSGTWLGIIAAMTISTVAAVVSLIRGIAARSVQYSIE